ncbi:MAG: HPF/RaiA family ribosome-associated protein [Bacteroidales bacterium]|nr:HPF/RaiA family ribosome-associated protein [Bacteroidales bacterium]
MEIKIKSLKFDADKKLIEFVEKKVSRLEKFLAGAEADAEVVLTLEKDGKGAKIKIPVPGSEMVIERIADTFENAITECVDAMKEKLTRAKEKKYEM